ncbi:hypothetical protein X975_19614, partial [Stegodyphus mimosarum]
MHLLWATSFNQNSCNINVLLPLQQNSYCYTIMFFNRKLKSLVQEQVIVFC